MKPLSRRRELNMVSGPRKEPAAEGLGVTRKALSELVNGHTDVSRDMAIRLAKAFPDTDICLWLDLQVQYDTWQAEQRAPGIKVKPFPSPARA
jgi:antitoxin HigA-1